MCFLSGGQPNPFGPAMASDPVCRGQVRSCRTDHPSGDHARRGRSVRPVSGFQPCLPGRRTPRLAPGFMKELERVGDQRHDARSDADPRPGGGRRGLRRAAAAARRRDARPLREGLRSPSTGPAARAICGSPDRSRSAAWSSRGPVVTSTAWRATSPPPSKGAATGWQPYKVGEQA